MVVNTQAIVLSAIKYAEADLIVTCFTQSSGVKTYMLRGILKSKKGKMRTSYFQPLTQLDIVAKHKDKGTLEYLQDAKVIHHYQTLHTDVYKASMVFFLAEILKTTIKEEETNEVLYDFLSQSFQYLDTTDQFANFHIYFLLKLTMYLGFYPDDNDRHLPYFNLVEGVFQNELTNSHCEYGKNIELFKAFFGIKFDASSAIKLTKTERSDLLNLLLLYYKLHVQDFKKPKSLDVVQQLFN